MIDRHAKGPVMQITFVTQNEQKILLARAACQPAGIKIVQAQLDIPELQSDDGAAIASDKARQAFMQLQHPVVVTDDSWIIPGLKGFPGPYMKYMDQWLTPADWLRLTQNLKDRRIILRQVLAYHDQTTQKIFSVDITGTLLTESRGQSPHSHLSLTSFDQTGRSAAQVNSTGISFIAHLPTAWHELCKWLNAR